MADQDLIQYIKEHKGSHGVAKLKEGLKKQGVSDEEIEEALDFIKKEKDKKSFAEANSKISKEVEKIEKVSKNILTSALKVIGVIREQRNFYSSVVFYGALSFIILNVIVTVFEYVSGRLVYARVANDLGVFGPLALPGIFVVNIDLLSLFVSVIWSAVIGGILLFLFFRYLLGVWPLKLWSSLFNKIFAFFLILELFFGIFINGILESLSFIYILGYLLISLGMAFASYISAFYLITNLERKHGGVLNEVVRKSL